MRKSCPPASLPALPVGFTSGLTLLVAQVAFGTFIFSGDLAPYSSQGVGLVLFGNFAACLIVAIMGGYRGTISGLSSVLVIVMATIVATMEADGEAPLRHHGVRAHHQRRSDWGVLSLGRTVSAPLEFDEVMQPRLGFAPGVSTLTPILNMKS